MGLLRNLIHFAVSIFRQIFLWNRNWLQPFHIRLYTGQINNMTPPPWICITQASMIYASGAMVGVSTLIFMLHVRYLKSNCDQHF